MDHPQPYTRVLIVCDDSTLLYPFVEFVSALSGLPLGKFSVLRITRQPASSWAYRFFFSFDKLRVRQRESEAADALRLQGIELRDLELSRCHDILASELRAGDLLVCFTDEINRLDLRDLPCSTYQLSWSGFPIGFWEVFNRAALSRVCLKHLAGATWCPLFMVETRTHEVSPIINRARMERSAWGLVTILLRDYLDQEPTLASSRLGRGSQFDAEHQRERPQIVTVGVLLKLLWRAVLAAFSTRIAERDKRVQWSVGVLPVPVDPNSSLVATGVRWMEPPPGSFIADPFPCGSGERSYLFVEQYLYEQKKGVISVCSMLDGVPQADLRIVLDEPFHLSYPFVFEHQGQHYLLPERSTTGKVVLYQAAQFPDQWHEVATLLPHFPGVDPTLFYYQERWWLFCSMGGLSMQDSNLHLFYSNNFQGPYTPHPLNPVVLDITKARMAGRIVEIDGALYRPAQDCSSRYGSRVVFLRIMKLSPSEYLEECVGTIEADKDAEFGEALHTVQINGSTSLITGMRYS